LNGIASIARRTQEVMSEELPLVSIVTPSYNQAQFLEETILSVLNQDYPNLEYIIIDGGSVDGSLDIIRKYEHRLAYWVSEPDEGQSDAINKGWRRARGEILAWLNSDDTYVPGAIRTVAQYLVTHPEVDMVYGHLNTINDGGRVIWTTEPSTTFDLDGLIYSTFFVPQPTVFFRKHVVHKVGMLDTSLYYCMDCDLWHRIGINFTVRGIASLVANFRTHLASKTHDVPLEFVIERYRVARRYGGPGNAAPAAEMLAYRWAQSLTYDFAENHREWIEQDWASVPPEISSLLQPSKRRITSKAYLKAALALLVADRLGPAATCFVNAVKQDPLVVLRDGGIPLSVLRASRRFLGDRRRGSTGAEGLSSGQETHTRPPLGPAGGL
jgi:glycosyltransferase involved in cell wall biosynthesis